MNIRNILWSVPVITGLMFSSPALGAVSPDFIWLSDNPPPKNAKVIKPEKTTNGNNTKPSGHQHNGTTDDEDGTTIHRETKHLWLRSGGGQLKAAPYTGIDSSVLNLVDNKGTFVELTQVAQSNGLFHNSVDLRSRGFYSVYLTQGTVTNDILQVRVAKAELLYGTCSHIGIKKEETIAYNAGGAIPIEIVREHYPDEFLWTSINSGNEVTFTVLRNGEPAAGVPVRMITDMGWEKSAISDARGRVKFTIVRDYYPKWTEFRKYHKETFVVVADYDDKNSGSYDGKPYKSAHYQATLSGHYAPSPYDYRSYAYGLGISLGVLAFTGVGIYVYRRRRTKPFKEVRYDEKGDK